MKKTILQTTLIIFVLALLIPFVQAELVTRGSAIDATLLYYQPVPAQPGDLIDVYILIENDGGSTTEQGTIEIFDSNTFSLISESDRIQQFPGIPGQKSFLLKTKVRIAKNANEGTGILQIRVQEDGSSTYTDRDLEIEVTGTSSAITIIEAIASPKEVLPGERTSLTITIENVGSTEVRNLDIGLDLDTATFIPIDNSDSRTIRSLSGGEKKTFIFELVSHPTAEPQIVQIPVNITYDDETGNEKTQEDSIGMFIGTIPELLVYIDRSDLTKGTPEGEVVIRFVNKGLAEIKFLEMRIQESDTVSVISESSVLYVGNIDEDDYESAQVRVKFLEDETQLPLTVKYRDSLNRVYEETFTLEIKLRSANENGKRSKIKWILAIVIIAGGVYWWRKKNTNLKKRR